MEHFFIIGAQKSGTTSLAHALSQHPDICFSLPKEPMFFSYDDAAVHPHLFIQRQTDWLNSVWHDIGRQDIVALFKDTFFPNYRGEAYLGEASTSYLPSRYACDRINHLFPDAKIIMILRHPVDRAYSAYWHYVRTGIATETFMRHLQYENGMTLVMGEYEQFLRYWLNSFDTHAIKVVFFEEMRVNPYQVLDEIYSFLSLPKQHYDIKKLNVGRYPKRLKLHLYLNWLSRNKHQVKQEKTSKSTFMELYLSAINRIQDLNLTDDKSHLGINTDNYNYLNQYYQIRNSGLFDLIDNDPRIWGWE